MCAPLKGFISSVLIWCSLVSSVAAEVWPGSWTAEPHEANKERSGMDQELNYTANTEPSKTALIVSDPDPVDQLRTSSVSESAAGVE